MPISSWCKRPSSGDLTERVEIQNPTAVRGFDGSSTLAWQTVATVYADVYGASGREVIMAMTAETLVTHKVKMRFRDDVDGQTRLLWRGKEREVVVALPRYNRAYLEIMCREVEE